MHTSVRNLTAAGHAVCNQKVTGSSPVSVVELVAGLAVHRWVPFTSAESETETGEAR